MEAKHNTWKTTSSQPWNFPPKKYFSIAELTTCRQEKIKKPLQITLLISAKNIKTDIAKAAISGIIPRRDTFYLKAKQINETLKKICNIFHSFRIMVLTQVSIWIAVMFI